MFIVKEEFSMKNRNNGKTMRVVTGLFFLAPVIFVFLTGCPDPVSAYTEQSGTPTADVTAVAKTSGVQQSVSFALTSTNTGEWKVYDAETGGETLAGVSAAFTAPTLTLTASGSDLAADTYYVSVTEDGKMESARLALTVGPYVSPQSSAPTVDPVAVTVAKDTETQQSVSFTLTSAPAGEWKVYGSEMGGDALTDVTASLSGSTLALTASGDDLPAATYYVSVTEPGKAESIRLGLTVGSYVHSGESGTPAAAVRSVFKTSLTQKTVSFTLTSTNTGTWKVYDSAAGGEPLDTVTASFSAPTLTLTASGDNLPGGTYYVTVTETDAGKIESAPLALAVKEVPRGTIQVTFTGPTDETIGLNGNGQALSVSGNTSLTVTVTGAFDAYNWYKDGVAVSGETGNSITVTGNQFTKGTHTLAVQVSKSSVYYSKLITFTVTN
jgi:ABC-type transporter MlaC component